jgi:hypothetical protein
MFKVVKNRTQELQASQTKWGKQVIFEGGNAYKAKAFFLNSKKRDFESNYGNPASRTHLEVMTYEDDVSVVYHNWPDNGQ